MDKQYLNIKYLGMTDGALRATSGLLRRLYDYASKRNFYYDWSMEGIFGGWRFCFSCPPASKALKDIAARLSDVAELIGNRVSFSGKVRGATCIDGSCHQLVGHETGVCLEYVPPAAREVTMAEVCEKFGYEVKIVKG